ncbi:MAG: (2Fe-2S)-binding protein [Balneolaceae bacterium]|nr:(2Fe-2S)-binding protein [Balneolaceae bacterium]
MSRYKVDRCICRNRSFEEIRDYARRNDIDSVEVLKERSYCSDSCGLCEPYVAHLLCSGRTVFEPGEFYRKKEDV